MLQLKKINKEYYVGDTTIVALNDVSIQFRQSEFVSILGPSGCGKTTLLNIVGGLDRYTTGDLVIDGRSTEEFKDRDWDLYRNHSVGFVFQNYNLIPHLTVVENVELALTLSGISKSERRQRATEVLGKVGLSDKLSNRPNQLSGGQMQRVAIARALINDPEILLADEPTGALDTVTSKQIMKLLKEISQERLIIMVTHNPELAEKYSTRIIRLLDGKLIDDTNPYDGQVEVKKADKSSLKKGEKTSMSFFTALSLSFKNLLTKKARTIMVALAGSIGIIGIALILSLSSGFQSYIDKVQRDTLSTYPITIQGNTIDMSSLLAAIMGNDDDVDHDYDKIYSNDIMVKMLQAIMSQVHMNDLGEFMKYIEKPDSPLKQYTTAIQYQYGVDFNIYHPDTNKYGVLKVNPSTLFEDVLGSLSTPYGDVTMRPWSEMLDNDEFLKSQYDLVGNGSKWPSNYDEVLVVLDENNEINDYTLYTLGLKDPAELKEILKIIQQGGEYVPTPVNYEYEDIIGINYKLLLNTDYYQKNGNVWEDKTDDEEFIKNKINNGLDIKVVGIVKPKEDALVTSITGTIAYTAALTKEVSKRVADSQIMKEQVANPTINVFTGTQFVETEITEEMFLAFVATLPPAEQALIKQQITEKGIKEVIKMFKERFDLDATYDGNLKILGNIDLANPSVINIYPIDFAAKEEISKLIEEYNKTQIEIAEAEGNKDQAKIINYTDYVGIMMSSVSTIINAITYVLIGFVAISLIVSSIMIGIITYISVLERIKEIGILRSIGASKRDISRVFNAETLIIGFASGIFGILVTLVLNIPVNILINSLAGIKNVSSLPILGGVILVVISMLLTFIAGLIPARIASKKDPVIALRTE